MDMHDWEKVCNRPTLVATEDEGTDQGSGKALTKAAAENFLLFHEGQDLHKMKETAPRTEDLALEWKNLLQRMK
jgi:hypothetical protein